MNDKPTIVAGLVIALVALTFPFWRPLLAGRPSPPPRPDAEPRYVLPKGQCVERNMRARHMQVLKRWRDEVVRYGDARPVTVSGVEYPKSLTRGCMKCHVSNKDFCARCHDYADVQPNCWDCHVAPEGE
jgi:hypothetical protein